MTRRSFALLAALVSAAITAPASSFAQTPADSIDDADAATDTLDAPAIRVVLDRFRVVGDEIARLPGSAHVIGPVELEAQPTLFDDAHRILRTVPGVYVQEEEGFGLRPNIGIRGAAADLGDRW